MVVTQLTNRSQSLRGEKVNTGNAGPATSAGHRWPRGGATSKRTSTLEWIAGQGGSPPIDGIRELTHNHYRQLNTNVRGATVSMKRITVLLADDNRVMRTEFRKILELEDDLEVVGEAKNGLQAVAMVKKLHPAVVLMDIAMPLLNGW